MFSRKYFRWEVFSIVPVTEKRNQTSFSYMLLQTNIKIAPKLKLIKTYLRSSMAQSRLSNLAIISIENDEAKAIDRDNLVFKFASLNARRERRFQT